MVTQVTTIETNSSLEWYTITTHSNSILTSKKILINNGTSSSTQTFHEAINTFSNDSLQNSSKQPHNEKVSILTTNQTKDFTTTLHKENETHTAELDNFTISHTNSGINSLSTLSTINASATSTSVATNFTIAASSSTTESFLKSILFYL